MFDIPWPAWLWLGVLLLVFGLSVSILSVALRAAWDNRVVARQRQALAMAAQALRMVLDADDDCHRDGLRTMPLVARASLVKALNAAEAPEFK